MVWLRNSVLDRKVALLVHSAPPPSARLCAHAGFDTASKSPTSNAAIRWRASGAMGCTSHIMTLQIRALERHYAQFYDAAATRQSAKMRLCFVGDRFGAEADHWKSTQDGVHQCLIDQGSGRRIPRGRSGSPGLPLSPPLISALVNRQSRVKAGVCGCISRQVRLTMLVAATTA